MLLLDTSLSSKDFVVASCLPALGRETAGQAGTLKGISEVLPCFGAILLLLDVRLVHGLLENDILE